MPSPVKAITEGSEIKDMPNGFNPVKVDTRHDSENTRLTERVGQVRRFGRFERSTGRGEDLDH